MRSIFCPRLPLKQERAAKRVEMRTTDPNHNSFPIVITSYEIVIRDRKDLASFPWKYIIVDEGHRLKNLNCRLIKELKMYNSANRLLLTGTPLQNNLSELWSLLNFLLPVSVIAVFPRLDHHPTLVPDLPPSLSAPSGNAIIGSLFDYISVYTSLSDMSSVCVMTGP